MDFFDLNASSGSKGFSQLSKKLGWGRAITPAIVSSKDVQGEARKVRNCAEVIIARGNDAINRLASDCWEVDLIGSPEMHDEGDFMHQSNSGIDYVIGKACAEKGIAVEFSFANVLNTFGRKRSQVLARMAQNVAICRGCKCGMVITSGAKDEFGLRAPRDLAAFGIALGMSMTEAVDAVSKNPEAVLGRSLRRGDENTILKGLEVKKWASAKKEKKAYGWY